ncbi:hypothetical protein EO95_03185 [Methanosarcina sp. 1.H.T.1A.1]|nr:hypothetical protein EO95_03185 [Methanosarcina sp. 1.H.T.1A.1]
MMETLSGIKLMDSFDPQLIAGFDEIWDATFHHKWQPIYKKDLRLQQNYDLYRSSKSSIYEAIESGFEWYRVRISSRFINLFPKSGYFYNNYNEKSKFEFIRKINQKYR